MCCGVLCVLKGWRPIAAAIITADEPGLSSNELAVFEPLREHKLAYWPTHPGAVYEHAQHRSATAAADTEDDERSAIARL